MDEHEPFPEEDVEPAASEAPPAASPEVPEADAVEQSIEIRQEPDGEPESVDLVPEADALEQARVVDVDDEDRG